MDPNKVSALFERATADHGQDSEDLWIRYIQWELQQQQESKITKLYWKAKHTLRSPDNFMAQYSLLLNSKEVANNISSR